LIIVKKKRSLKTFWHIYCKTRCGVECLCDGKKLQPSILKRRKNEDVSQLKNSLKEISLPEEPAG
jgi:hypothetical protein